MINLNMNRWCGAALVAGSLLFIVNKFNDMSQVFLDKKIPDVIAGENILLVALGPVLLVIGFLGCYRLYAGRCNHMGKIGLGLLLSGGVLLAVGHVTFTPLVQDSPLFLFVLLGVLLIAAGLALFGAVNLRAHALEKWQALPLITGVLCFVGFVGFGGENNPQIFLTLRTLFGAGLVLMGIALWQDTRAVSIRAEQVA